jgi:hypothetical protein
MMPLLKKIKDADDRMNRGDPDRQARLRYIITRTVPTE